MLGRPLRERVAMRETIDLCKIARTTGSSMFIVHLVQRSVIPGDRLERGHLEPDGAGGRVGRSLDGLYQATDRDGAQVEVVDPLIDEEDDLLARAWLAIRILRNPSQMAPFLPHQHNRLSLRPVVASKADTGARNSLQQIPRAPGIDVPGDLLHEYSS